MDSNSKRKLENYTVCFVFVDKVYLDPKEGKRKKKIIIISIIVALIIAGIVLMLNTWGKSIIEIEDAYVPDFLVAGILITSIGLFLWIRRGIKASYLRWAKDHNDELYKKEIAEKDKEIQRLTELSDTLRTANHNIIHRLAALEKGYITTMDKLTKSGLSMEISEDLAISAEDVRRTMRDYMKDAGRNGIVKSLPTTKIKMLDDIFSLFAERCKENHIEFNLIVNASIPYMVEKIIDQTKLEIMIGDHLQDALVAVKLSDNLFRNILLTLGLMEKHYALTIFDSGIPFEAETLTRLGTEYVTTHLDSGGSGRGFMKTFATMREYGASLIICEREPGAAGHSKSITIKFDGQNQYIIETYRPESFPQSLRYIVKRHLY
jgi:signal transduction histidine kinase